MKRRSFIGLLLSSPLITTLKPAQAKPMKVDSDISEAFVNAYEKNVRKLSNRTYTEEMIREADKEGQAIAKDIMRKNWGEK